MPSSTSSSETARARFDQHLVREYPERGDLRYCLTLMVAFLAITGAWIALVNSGLLPKAFVTLSDSEANRASVIEFVNAGAPIALSGTSLTYRLAPEYFTGAVGNASITGGNPASSARIAALSKPEILVIEINILERPFSTEMEKIADDMADPLLNIDAFGRKATPMRAAVAAMFNLDAQQSARGQAMAAEAETLLASPPAAPLPTDGALKNAADLAKRGALPDNVQATIGALLETAAQVEADGGKVFYIMMPLHDIAEAEPLSSDGKRHLEATDPDFDRRFLDIDWDRDALRWADDGLHLDDRSAVLVARQLEAAVLAAASK